MIPIHHAIFPFPASNNETCSSLILCERAEVLTRYGQHVLCFPHSHVVPDHTLVRPTVIHADWPPKHKFFPNYSHTIWEGASPPVGNQRIRSQLIHRYVTYRACDSLSETRAVTHFCN